MQGVELEVSYFSSSWENRISARFFSLFRSFPVHFLRDNGSSAQANETAGCQTRHPRGKRRQRDDKSIKKSKE